MGSTSYRPREDVQREWMSNTMPFSQSVLKIESDVPLNQIGIIGVYSQRDLTDTYAHYLREARVSIWALGTGLGGFQSHHRDILIDKARLGLDIRLLAADPDVNQFMIRTPGGDFPLTEWRDRVSGTGEYNTQNVHRLSHWFAEINEEVAASSSATKKPVQLRYYTAIPNMALILANSTLFFSPYLVHLQNLKNATFKVKQGTRLFDQFIDHFSYPDC